MTELKSGIKFDATINLGHIITFIGFILAGFGAWSTIDKRLVVLEEGRKLQAQIDSAQDTRSNTATDQLANVIGRLEKQVDRLNDKLDRIPPRGH